MRRVDVTQALRTGKIQLVERFVDRMSSAQGTSFYSCLCGEQGLGITYQTPAAKMAIIISFLLSGICNFQMGTIGRIGIEKSETTLNTPVAM